MQTLDVIHEQQDTFDATKIEDIQEEIIMSHRSLEADGPDSRRVGRNFLFGNSTDHQQNHVIKQIDEFEHTDG